MASATAGPWEARADRTVAAAGVPLLRCYAGRNDGANARLVASAPDLLAACKAWLDHYDTFVRTPELGDEPGIAQMRAAVLSASEG